MKGDNMAKKTMGAILAATLIIAAALSIPMQSLAASAPRISPEVLKALLGNPEVVVIDVRRGKDWGGSNSKIQSARRESEKDISWAGKYDKDTFLVLYCA